MARPDIEKTSLAQKFGSFQDHWSPKIAGEINDAYVKLVKFQGGDDTILAPDDGTKYTLEFAAGGRLIARVDCNRGRGTWRSTGVNQVEFQALMLTRAECARGSIDKEFIKQWPTFKSYAIRDGHLFLAPMAEGGTYEFEPLASAF